MQIDESTEVESQRQGRIFPDTATDKTTAGRIVDCALTADFLVMVTDAGHVQYFQLDDWTIVNDFKHSCGIKGVFVEPSGTRLVFIDERRDLFVYNPANDALVPVSMPPLLNGAIRTVAWEQFTSGDRDVFVVVDQATTHTYSYRRERLTGPDCVLVGSTKLPYAHSPLVLYNGKKVQKGLVAFHRQSPLPNSIRPHHPDPARHTRVRRGAQSKVRRGTERFIHKIRAVQKVGGACLGRAGGVESPSSVEYGLNEPVRRCGCSFTVMVTFDSNAF